MYDAIDFPKSKPDSDAAMTSSMRSFSGAERASTSGLAAFTALVTGSSHGNPTAFFPVLWAPIATDECPPAIQKVQRFSPAGFSGLGLERRYNELGLLGVMETMGRRNTYKAIVWSLAKSIADFSYDHEVEPRVFHEEDLRNVFEEGAL